MRVWKHEEILNLLQTSDIMVMRSLLKLYGQQTPSEVSDKEALIKNKVGFNRFDAPFLSSLSEQLSNKKYLTPCQIIAARKKLLKYSRQLTFLANIDYYVSLRRMKNQLAIK